MALWQRAVVGPSFARSYGFAIALWQTRHNTPTQGASTREMLPA